MAVIFSEIKQVKLHKIREPNNDQSKTQPGGQLIEFFSL